MEVLCPKGSERPGTLESPRKSTAQCQDLPPGVSAVFTFALRELAVRATWLSLPDAQREACLCPVCIVGSQGALAGPWDY